MVFFDKSQPAPASLAIEKAKANGSYNQPDVVEMLKNDFKRKCYICEFKSTTNNIEHLVPHKGNKDLMFDWNNLFLACGHCNNTKIGQYDDILNCTDKLDDVENKLKYIFEPINKEIKIEVLDTKQKTNNTKNLLVAIYNGTTTLKKIDTENLIEYLENEIDDFQEKLKKYRNTNDMQIKAFYLPKVKEHLSRASNFTAFKRWIIKDNQKLKAEFEQYFD